MSEIHTINNVLRREVEIKFTSLEIYQVTLHEKQLMFHAEDSKTYLDQRLESGKGYQRPGKFLE